jgi:high-affinity Fe2+/Pb2+ permease
MKRRRLIAMLIGGAVSGVFFTAGMLLMVYGGEYSTGRRIVFISIGIGPLAAVSVMVGYAVWWPALFLMSLFAGDSSKQENTVDKQKE